MEDYDANIARYLVSGVDLWLNNPRRPLEASGTSGQKAGLNGVPNFSVLDGWWAEGFEGDNGWAIGAEREYPTEAAQDEADALSLYTTLENDIVPMFYDRDAAGIPARWLAVMRASIASVAPDYSFDRMLKEYEAKFYIPADLLGRRVRDSGFAGAQALAKWEARVQAGWPQVTLTASGPAHGEMMMGSPLAVQATLQPGPLHPDDLAVELVCGRERDGRLSDATALPMRRVAGQDGAYRYEAAFDVSESGTFAYGVRVRPAHPLPAESVRAAPGEVGVNESANGE